MSGWATVTSLRWPGAVTVNRAGWTVLSVDVAENGTVTFCPVKESKEAVPPFLARIGQEMIATIVD